MSATATVRRTRPRGPSTDPDQALATARTDRQIGASSNRYLLRAILSESATHNRCQLTRGRADVAQFTSEAMESVPSFCGRRRRDRGPLCRTGNGGDWNRHYRTQQPALSARAVRTIAMRLSRARCVYRKLNPNVLMMKSTQDSERTYEAGSLNRTRDRRILLQRAMRSNAVVIGGISA
jgi:hypothetical protein